MPFVQANPYALYDDKLSRPLPQPEEPDYSVGEVFGAAFMRENSLGSLYERVFGDGAQGRYESPDENFDYLTYDAISQIVGTRYQDYASQFTFVSNDSEFAQVKARLDRELKREQILSESGGLGLVAGLAAGILDPINLIPVGGQAVLLSRVGGSLLRGVGAGARAGLLGSAASEAALHATQDTRTWEESAINIGAGAILAGALGGGIAGLRHRAQKKDQVGRLHDAVKADPTATQGRNPDDAVELEIANEKATPSIKQSALGDNPPVREDLEEAVERDLTLPPEGEPDLSAPVPPSDSSVGAKMAQDTSLEDEGLAGTFGVGEAVAWADPLNRSLHSPSVVMRRVTQQLAEIPLTLAKNARGLVTGVSGGSVETRIKVRQAPLMQALKRMDDLYIQYRKGRARRMGDLAVQGVQDLINRTEGKLTRKGFHQAIGEAMRRGDAHEIPEVAEAARLYREQVFEPLKNDAIKLGLLPEDVEVKTAASYLMRQYNFEKIAAQRPEFKRVIAQWLGEEQGKKAAIQERVQAVFAEVEEVTEALRQTQEEIVTQKALIDAPDTLPEVIAPGTVLSGDLIGQFYRRFIRGSKVQGPLKATPFFEIADVDPRALAEAARLSPAFANAPQTFRISAIALKHAWDSRVKGKVPAEMINDLFDNVGNILKAPDEVLPNPREGSEDTVLFVQKINTHGRDRDVFAVVEVGADGKFLEIRTVIGPHSKSSSLVKARRLKAAEDATDGGASRLGDAEGFPHLVGTETAPHAGNSVSDVPSVAGRTIDPMEGAGKRLEELLARDADLRMQLAELETSLPTRLEDLVGQWQGKASRTAQGAIKRRDAKGPSEKVARRKEADQAIMEAAEIIARSQQDLPASELDLLASQIIDRILGTPMGRLPYDQPVPSETAYGKPRNSNGDLAAPLKERSFNIPDELIEPWLESDIEVIAKAYQRSLVPDLELVRAFGDLELTDVRKAIERDFATLAERAPDEATRTKLQKQHNRAILDLEGMRDRIRGRYALPDDPHSFLIRAPQFMRNMNYLSKLGGMVISAAADLGRPGMVHGMRVFSAGLIPLVRNVKGYRLAAEEVKLAGAGWEMISNARALAMADMMDDYGRGTALERGVKGLADHFGLVSLMAPWNAALKQFSGIITTSRLIDAAMAARAGTITDKELANLAASGISEDMGRRIADQFDRFGRVEDGGIRLPETGNWTDREAAEALRAAIVRDVDRIIVTPGQDKPLWMSREVGKTIGQFRSFGFAAVQRILLSGLQQRDAAALSGAVLSVALGMGVYALKTMQYGGELSDDPTQWLVEGVDRSGLFGWLMDMNNTAEKVVRGVLNIPGGVSRYQSRNEVAALAGPSLGLIQDANQVLGSAVSGDWRQSDTRAIRRILTYQNLFYLRGLFDTVEDGINQGLGVRE